MTNNNRVLKDCIISVFDEIAPVLTTKEIVEAVRDSITDIDKNTIKNRLRELNDNGVLKQRQVNNLALWVRTPSNP